jgi:hypothetical protein
MKQVLALISFVDKEGNPIDPGFGGGHPGGPDAGYDRPAGGHADQDLPIHGHPGNRPPGWRPNRPDQGPARPPWDNVSPWPPSETDPEWGVGAPRPPHPGYIPIDPAHPGNVLPPVHGHPAPPIATTPPGTIWPPLPPGSPTGKAAILVWIVGVGYRYAVVDLGASAGTPLPPAPQPK